MAADGLLARCWEAVGGRGAALEELEVARHDRWLGGPLAVDDLAVGAVGAALLAAAELAEARTGRRPIARLCAEHVAVSFRSERHALVGGGPLGAGFAPLSRFVRCGDGGWVRTHANYPHHAAALGRALNIEFPRDAEAAVAALQTAAGALAAVTLEQAIVDAGGCAAALRSQGAWAAHPAGRAATADPLVAWDEGLATRVERPLPRIDGRSHGPASGVRVLELTRVIAGPVAGRTLAALGADVLRIDPPGLAELPEQHVDTGAGKRTALLDLADVERREALLAGADVVLMGYRPGALARFGLDAPTLAERHPHLMQIALSAWGTSGPWARRRGFDSLVQAASGIADACAAPDGTPGVLPAQALDHATGHLMAAAALRGLTRRVRGEPVAAARVSLAGTAAALLGASRYRDDATDATGTANPDRYRVEFGDLSLVGPPGSLDDAPLRWAHGPRPLGQDEPAW